MEAMVKKFRQKYGKLREYISQWDQLQLKLTSEFRNACSVIGRLQVIQNKTNYGCLKVIDGVEDLVLRKQLESLEDYLQSTTKTMEEFEGVVSSLEKIVRDGRQLIKGVGSQQQQISIKQKQQRIGLKPSLSDCVDGLVVIHEMYHSEYLLKSSVVSALSKIVFKPSASNDLDALQQLLLDQPNIIKDEVDTIFDIISAEEFC